MPDLGWSRYCDAQDAAAIGEGLADLAEGLAWFAGQFPAHAEPAGAVRALVLAELAAGGGEPAGPGEAGNPSCVRCSGGPPRFCACREPCGFAGCGAKMPALLARAHRHDDDGRLCAVLHDPGQHPGYRPPAGAVHEAEIVNLRDDAAAAGDTALAGACNAALTGDQAAWAHCAATAARLRGAAESYRTAHPGAWNRMQAAQGGHQVTVAVAAYARPPAYGWTCTCGAAGHGHLPAAAVQIAGHAVTARLLASRDHGPVQVGPALILTADRDVPVRVPGSGPLTAAERAAALADGADPDAVEQIVTGTEAAMRADPPARQED